MKISIISLSFLLLIVFFSHCKTSKISNQINQDLVLKKYFEKSERKELAKIIDYTDSIIISKYEHSDINKAYHLYLDSLYNLLNERKFEEISFNEEAKYKFLFNIDTNVFNEIWNKSNTIKKVKTKDTILNYPKDFIYIDLNYEGKYFEMINYLGQNDELFSVIYSVVSACGDLSPTLQAGFLYNNKKYDFTNIQYRLWVSIFILSLEETTDMKVERYLINQKIQIK